MKTTRGATAKVIDMDDTDPGYRSLEVRKAAGLAARERLPLAEIGELTPDADDPNRNPTELLMRQASSRVPELMPVRHGRMARTAFTFYRGAALLMADDLSRSANSGLEVQLCGDAHLSNFGFFATPERHLAFDVNDFDETHPGPFEWDVKRLVASLVVAGLDNGFGRKASKRIARHCAREYRETIAAQASLGTLESWYSHVSPTEDLTEVRAMVDAKMTKDIRKQIEKSWRRDSAQALSKLTTVVGGELRFISTPPLLVPIEELAGDHETRDIYAEVQDRLVRFRTTMQPHHAALLDKFRFVRIARKVVGVGSVGTRAWVLLFCGKDNGDPLLLQAKEAQPSVLADYVADPGYANQGERVVLGQRLIQATGDVFLGWDSGAGLDGQQRDFYLRQLRDAKGSILIETLDEEALSAYGRACGRVLAYGHARSGDAVAIAEYLGESDEFDRAMGRFGEVYAERNARDHDSFVDAIDRGVVAAVADL
ncbi:DUF2252 domain-containing protein [Gordonia sp. CPCC 205515]|uniref:DUF2252 domain-containing protein n=1 Tax=Gordonia sp. CPCC 205515 TaxID=3140791 RepID=UPI003AF3AC02